MYLQLDILQTTLCHTPATLSVQCICIDKSKSSWLPGSASLGIRALTVQAWGPGFDFRELPTFILLVSPHTIEHVFSLQAT